METKAGVSVPAGRARVRVRGLAASMAASATAVKGHGGGARGYHGDDDPDELMRGGQAMGGEHGSGKGEGEREDGVLPLDHLERGAQVMEERHWISLTEVWDAGLRVWGISEWSGCGVVARAKADSSWLKPFGMTRLIEWVRGTRCAACGLEALRSRVWRVGTEAGWAGRANATLQ